MKFYSTNNKNLRVSFKEALILGIPLDNGLFMPEYIPDNSNLINGIDNLSFQDISFVIAKSFLSEDFKNPVFDTLAIPALNQDTFNAELESIALNWLNKSFNHVEAEQLLHDKIENGEIPQAMILADKAKKHSYNTLYRW